MWSTNRSQVNTGYAVASKEREENKSQRTNPLWISSLLCSHLPPPLAFCLVGPAKVYRHLIETGQFCVSLVTLAKVASWPLGKPESLKF